MKRFMTVFKTLSASCALAALLAGSAYATEGMFANGTGARNKALAGAGVADQNDATAIAINPAGLVHSENQLDVSASLFSPNRKYSMNGGAFNESDSKYFVIPNIAYSTRVDANTVFGLSIYGNGGMNTDYPANFVNAGDPNLGVDLTQIFISAGVAKQYGNLSLGIAPIVAIQIFSADGLGAMGISEKTDVAAGVGVRGGVEWAVSNNFRLAASAASPIWSQDFSDYDGKGKPVDLFKHSGGELRVPATIQAGVAFDPFSGFTIMADYKRIFYSTSKAISTKFNPFTASGGYGWKDINVYKIGVEWDVSPDLTLRAGYSYNDQPLRSDANHYFPNIMTPGTSQHHITGGAQFTLTDNVDMELAGMYSPSQSVSTPGGGGLPSSTVKMSQWELTAGIKWKLGE